MAQQQAFGEQLRIRRGRPRSQRGHPAMAITDGALRYPRQQQKAFVPLSPRPMSS